MAIQWMDFPNASTGIYGTNNALLLDGIYASGEALLTEDPDPNVTGNVLRHSTSIGSGTSLRKVLPGASDVVGVAFRNWLASLPSGGAQDVVTWSLIFKDGGGGALGTMNFGPAGQIYIRSGAGLSGIVAQSAIDVIRASSWQHIEVKMTFAGEDASSVEVYVNGDEVINETGITLGGATCALVSWERNFDTASTQYMKDYVIYDDTGGWGTGPLGTVTVYDLGAAGDVSSGWTPSTGSSAAAILNNAPPNDSEYISAVDSPLPAPAIVSLGSLPDDVTSVRALMSIVRARKSDGGDGNLQMGLISDGDTDLGANHSLTTAFAYWTDISHLDPATSAQWTPSGVDDAEFQLNRTV